MIKIVPLLILIAASTIYSQSAMVRFHKSTQFVIGGEYGFGFPYNSVRFLPSGEYHTMQMEQMTAYGFKFGVSMPLQSFPGTHAEINLRIAGNSAEKKWQQKYIMAEDGYEAVNIVENNSISSFAVNGRLYRYLSAGEQNFYLFVGAEIGSISHSRDISFINELFHGMNYPADDNEKSFFEPGFDCGGGLLFRFGRTSFIRAGYRAGFVILPEQEFAAALIPFESKGFYVTHSLALDLLLRM